MANLTDMGLLNDENVRYLYSRGILTRDGGIRRNFVEGYIPKGNVKRNRRVLAYSYFNWIIDDIKDKIPSIPRSVYLGVDDYTEIMRTGQWSKEYVDEDKIERVYRVKYPVVADIIQRGRVIYGMSADKDAKEIVDFNF